MDRVSWIAFSTISIIFGSTFLAIRIGLDYMPPFTFAALRFLLASALLFVYLWLKQKRISLTLRQFGHLLVIGFFMTAFPFGLTFWGQQFVSSGMAAVLTSTMPFFVVFLAHFFLAERVTVTKILGVAVGFAGVLLLFIDQLGSGATLAGGLALVGSAAGYGVGNVYSKKFGSGIAPDVTNTIQTLVGGIILGVGSLLLERGHHFTFHWKGVVALLFLSVFGSAAFGLFFWLMQRATVTTMSLIAFAIPVVSVLLGTIVGETLSWVMLVGIILIFIGMALSQGTGERLFRMKNRLSAVLPSDE